MDLERQLDAHLRTLSLEARKKFPAVREAAERGLSSLRALSASGDPGAPARFRSADLLRPFLLACNHMQASPKLITPALNAMQTMLTYGAVPDEERMNVMRVLVIQVRLRASPACAPTRPCARAAVLTPCHCVVGLL